MIAAFLVICGSLLALDIGTAHHGSPVTLTRSAVWSGAYMLAALLFTGLVAVTHTLQDASLFLTGFVMEKALSVDNLMVFAAIFAYFKIPDSYQHRILHYGIIGAVVFRFIFVAVGAGSLALFGAPVGIVFGLLVLWSAWQMWASDKAEDEVDYANAWYVNWARVFIRFTNKSDGGKFWVAGFGTPLLMCLIAIEISDVLFSFDSVPAVIAVTQKPELVYTAMIFAVLGLRNLYFVLSALMRHLTRLESAVIIILGFIGLKMLAQSGSEIAANLGYSVPSWLIVSPLQSLGIVLLVLAFGVVSSIFYPQKETPSNDHGVVGG